MIELMPFLKELISLPGLSGYESPACEVISKAWQPLVDELKVSRLGSLYGLRKGTGAEPRPRILLAAHMDAIGLMVTGFQGSFIHVTEVGGVDPRILPGLSVQVHGKRALPGVVAMPSDALLPPDVRGKTVGLDHLLVDTGLPSDELQQLVKIGDLISFDTPPVEMGSDTISGHSLDNRSSVAAVTLCLQELQRMQHAWDVWAVATVQEEETLAGAFTAPFEIHPDIAVAIDVTFAKGPGASDYRTSPMGKGPTLGWGPDVHPAVHKIFKDIAEKLDIPFNIEIMPMHSGTDAIAMQVVAEGAPALVIGLPLRYMHTPVEIVSLKDISRIGHLLAEVIARLDASDVEKLRWDN